MTTCVRSWWRVGVFFLFLGFAGGEDVKRTVNEQLAIEATVSGFMAAQSAPGISVGIVEDGEYVWSGGFGMADLENSVPATSQTLYRLGSISKPISAIGAMQLWQNRKLDLDAPVQKYCPSFPQKQAVITTRQLLGHLSGIRHYHQAPNDPEVFNTTHFENPIEGGLKFFENDPLISEPGTHFNYTTHGYTVVGCVIEGASGDKYVDYIQRNVLSPAHMSSTQVDDRYGIIQHRTRFYQKDPSGKTVNADFLDSSYKIPGGGWLSSAEDMARFEVAILHNHLVTRKTLDLMWTPLKPSDSSEDTYGLGFGTFAEAGVRYVGHSGGQQGTSTHMLLAPDRGAGVVVLINMEGITADDLSKELMKIILQHQLKLKH